MVRREFTSFEAQLDYIRELVKETFREAGAQKTFKLLDQLRFSTEYPPGGMSLEELREAQAISSDFGKAKEQVAILSSEIDFLGVDLETSKPPFFGKKAFLAEKAEKERDLAEAKTQIEPAREAANRLAAKAQPAQDTVRRAERAYATDRKEFDKMVEGLTVEVCYQAADYPEGLESLRWEKAKLWFKDFFRQDPVRSLLPKAGKPMFKHLLVPTVSLWGTRSRWWDGADALIISGKERPLGGERGLYWEFIERFISDGQQHLGSVPFFLMLKADYHLVMAWAPIQRKYRLEIGHLGQWGILFEDYPKELSHLRKCRSLLEQVRSMALKAGNELHLNAVRSLESDIDEEFPNIGGFL